MTSRDHKRAAYEQLARIGKAIAAPKRLELLDLLCQAPRTVESIAQQAALSIANASQHLQVLRAARLVDSEKKGLHVEYRLADESVLRLLHSCREIAHSRLAEMNQIVRAFAPGTEELEPVATEELLRRMREGEVTVLDVRPAQEYRCGHFPGAISVPLAELKKVVATLPKTKEVVAYCRGPYCVMALEAVAVLRKKGFRAHRLEQGVIEWRARGWRIAVGESGGHA
jgi:rhodanese-related sulfurtransferase/DNA-binding transcriptional ArsR family regulator